MATNKLKKIPATTTKNVRTDKTKVFNEQFCLRLKKKKEKRQKKYEPCAG